MGNYIGPDNPRLKDTKTYVKFSASTGQTVFATTYTPGYLKVTQNGVRLEAGVDYTATNGTSFTLAVACVAGDVVEAESDSASHPYDFYTKTQADLKGTFYGIATGTGDAMTVNLTPVPTSLVDGMEFKVRAAGVNTAINPTLTIQGLAVTKTIYRSGGVAVQPGEWNSNQELTLRYNLSGDRLEEVSGGLGTTVLTLTDGPTISWNMQSGMIAKVTIGATGRTLNNPSNMRPGLVTLIVKQDATGNRTIGSWGSAFKWASGTPPTLTTTANATDVLTFVCESNLLYSTSITKALA